MRRLSLLLAGVFVFTGIHYALAGSDYPDLKGAWVMETKSVRHHKADEANPKAHHEVKSGFAQFKITYMIDKQDGFRFSGTMESDKTKERISGVIGFDNETLYIADDNGIALGKLIEPDKIQHVYLHVTKYDSVAGRGILIRKK